MKTYIPYLISCLLIGANGASLWGQGCVAIRSFSGCSTGAGSSAILKAGESVAAVNFRYFHSFRHFRGANEETERVEQGTQVINDSYFTDLSLTYAFADRYYATVVLPFAYHERSSMYEHGGNDLRDRHSTYAGGLSDVRLSAGYWLFDTENHPGKNLAVALGIKFPTGDYNAKGKFYNVGPNGETVTRPVDQSIQPGDGGTGLTVEMQGYHQIGHHFMLSGNFYYLINPREHNNTRRRPGADPYAAPDQFAIRVGASYATPVHGMEAYLGGRMECIPVKDFIGGNNAFRRPGYVISAEPGISYMLRHLVLNVSVPIAVERNRTQSYLDKKRERETGEPTHGDAAFADYLINVGLSYTF